MADDQWATGSATESDLREQARTAWTLGLVAMGLAMVAPCGSYLTLLGALPLGLMAMSRARRVLDHGSLDEGTEVYAKTGQITGLISAIWAGILLLIVGSVVLMYVGLFALAFSGNL